MTSLREHNFYDQIPLASAGSFFESCDFLGADLNGDGRDGSSFGGDVDTISDVSVEVAFDVGGKFGLLCVGLVPVEDFLAALLVVNMDV